ncbi:MAG: multicopper oxidase family protein [Phycisphaerae bacterium]
MNLKASKDERLSRRKMLKAGAAAAGASLVRPSNSQTPTLHARPAQSQPARPWREIREKHYPPGVPDRDYRPVFVPNGATLPFRIVDGVKVLHLIAEPIRHEVVDGLTINAWGYNGRSPGPLIELVQGDRVRIYVTNRLPRNTSVHWHAIILPNGMDGVGNITQPMIKPGETFRYEFTFPDAGTFMYHPHVDNMTQEGLGMHGMIVVHPREPNGPLPDRDFAIMLHEWAIDVGTGRPNPLEMTDFNVLTMNGRAHPGTYPLVAQLGDRVRIRFGNLSAMDHHPIHLHGYNFRITETDGGPIPREAQWPETTVLVHVGSTRTVEFDADNPGDWITHCHMTHHTMLQMGHGFPNMVGVDTRGLEDRIQKLIPGYMTMGQRGMMPMRSMDMNVPENSVPMLGLKGQFGPTVFGSMATVLKVRDQVDGYNDPGWYDFPEGTLARAATRAELQNDGIV